VRYITMSDERIYLSAPDIRHLEAEYVQDALESGWAAPAGPYLSRFESKLAETTGREYAVALTSGTAALHLALLELGVKKDDLVICSTLTFQNLLHHCLVFRNHGHFPREF